jgi:hypothetical protein
MKDYADRQLFAIRPEQGYGGLPRIEKHRNESKADAAPTA